MATNNKYKYWGNWGLSLRGVMGRLLTGTGVLPSIVKALGVFTVLRTRGRHKVLRVFGKWKSN